MTNLLRNLGLAGTICLGLAGCASTPVANPDPTDPMEGTNRSVYKFNDGLDRNFMAPVARGYRTVTPSVLRAGITNFFDNLGYLNVIANDLLQGKVKQFGQDSGRFVVNSTIGIGGLFDPATSMNLPAHSEDLGQTFGVWGAEEGTFLMLPMFGPNSTRDAPDLVTSMLLNPLFWVTSTISLPLTAVDLVNQRANLLETTEVLEDAAVDPYTYIREAYRQRRTYLIYDGNPPLEDYDELFDDEE